MKLSKERLRDLAEGLGYRAEILEKVLHLLELLQAIADDPWLCPRLALKGGTALNLFVLDLPRLSVDIDINYVGSVDKGLMESERPMVLSKLERLFRLLDLQPKGAPAEHAGGKWKLGYRSAVNENGNIEVDLNFLQRLPLWEPLTQDSRPLGGHQAKGVRVLDLHDLCGGKLTALLARDKARDLFDAAALALLPELDTAPLRTAFVAYGAASRTDWRTVSASSIKRDPEDLEDQLLPVLGRSSMPKSGHLKAWAQHLAEDAQTLLDRVLPLRTHEREFLDRLLDKGEIAPELLTQDEALAGRIAANPALAWKALNAREHAKKTRG
jgi:hypothetical protein